MTKETDLTWEEIREQFENRVIRLDATESAGNIEPEKGSTDSTVETSEGDSNFSGTEHSEETGKESETQSGSFEQSSQEQKDPHHAASTGADTVGESTARVSLSRSTNEPSAIPSPPSFDAPLSREAYDITPLYPTRREDKLTKVYKATHPDIDQPVVLKGPNWDATRDREKLKIIIQEAHKWQRFASADHVVTLINSGDSIEQPWIVMEYMDGGDLTDRIGDLSVEQAIWTGLAIVHGVYSAHRKAVQHLDIKPSNVLFQSMDDTWDIPKVADWGESQTVVASESSTAFTPKYAAPEQHLKEKRNLVEKHDIEWSRFNGDTTEIDQYQLGVVLYELLTGEFPFDTANHSIEDAKFEQDPHPPSELVTDLPPSADVSILRALETDPRDRYPNLAFLLRELAEVYDTVVERPVSLRGVKFDGWTIV